MKKAGCPALFVRSFAQKRSGCLKVVPDRLRTRIKPFAFCFGQRQLDDLFDAAAADHGRNAGKQAALSVLSSKRCGYRHDQVFVSQHGLGQPGTGCRNAVFCTVLAAERDPSAGDRIFLDGCPVERAGCAFDRRKRRSLEGKDGTGSELFVSVFSKHIGGDGSFVYPGLFR